MEHLTKSQLILLALLVSFITSRVTGIMTVALLSEGVAENPIQTIQRVIERSSNPPEEPQDPIISSEEKIVKIAENVTPAVVSVVATKDVSVIENYYLAPFGDILSGYGTQRRQVGAGTGFFVASDGTMVTTKHVVEDAEAEYSVIMNDGKKLARKFWPRNRPKQQRKLNES